MGLVVAPLQSKTGMGIIIVIAVQMIFVPRSNGSVSNAEQCGGLTPQINVAGSLAKISDLHASLAWIV